MRGSLAFVMGFSGFREKFSTCRDGFSGEHKLLSYITSTTRMRFQEELSRGTTRTTDLIRQTVFFCRRESLCSPCSVGHYTCGLKKFAQQCSLGGSGEFFLKTHPGSTGNVGKQFVFTREPITTGREFFTKAREPHHESQRTPHSS